MSNKKTAIIYVRVSSKNNIQSIESQISECLSFAKNNDIKVLDIFRSDGIINTEKVIEFITHINDMQNRPNLVLCKNLDRLRADAKNFLRLALLLSDFGINIQTTDGQLFNTSNLANEDDERAEIISVLPEMNSATNRLTRALHWAFSDFNSEMKAERVLKAMQDKFREGYWLWQAPYGYKRDDETREIVIDEGAAKIVIEIFHKLSVVEGEDRERVVAELAVKYNFPVSRIEKIVDNSFYAGEMCSTTWNMFVMGRHKPLVDFETLRKAQK